MAFFFLIFAHLGVNAWFSDVVQTAIRESQDIVQAYLRENRKVIEHSIYFMTQGLEFGLNSFSAQPWVLEKYLTAHTYLPAYDEALIVTGTGQVIARSQFSFALELEELSEKRLQQARKSIFIYSNKNQDCVMGLVQLSVGKDWYLLISRRLTKQ